MRSTMHASPKKFGAMQTRSAAGATRVAKTPKALARNQLKTANHMGDTTLAGKTTRDSQGATIEQS